MRATLSEQGKGLTLAETLITDEGVLHLELSGGEAATIRSILDLIFPGSDAIFAEDEIRVPQLFVSDMDSTMIGQECIDELADFAGLKPQIAAITERAMQGELDFESALRERVMLLRDLSEDAIQQCLTTRIEPMPGARTLVETLKALGCRTVLVTGGFHHFADPVAEQLGFERVVGNRLEVANGRMTGGLVGAITDSGVKKAVLLDEARELGADVVTMATGDGANDIPMLEAATYGIAYRAKPKARAAANGWIERGDLTSILRLLGIPQADWAAN
ncbi:MAG: phosphoserine phosphatase SerB [Novosphingobium sp.]|nr:phosphoserine phosphatase SerB [Novosphingobium sp.]MCP5380537.1 phosphoserine phosphatase SerB [Novosphingobium sp.]